MISIHVANIQPKKNHKILLLHLPPIYFLMWVISYFCDYFKKEEYFFKKFLFFEKQILLMKEILWVNFTKCSFKASTSTPFKV